MFEIVASLLVSVLAMAGAAGHPGRGHDEDDWPIAETRTFEESFELAAGQTPRVIVDDVWGSIAVEAGPAGRVTVSVRETNMRFNISRGGNGASRHRPRSGPSRRSAAHGR